ARAPVPGRGRPRARGSAACAPSGRRHARSGPVPPDMGRALLVHARRTGILPEEYRPRVFSTKTPHFLGTFLVDGAVAGTWRYERNRIAIEPFARLSREAKRELDDEAEPLATFHA